MVASVEQQTRQCSGPEDYFCRLVACEGYNASRAYKIAWKCKTTATENRQQASRVLARPRVQAKMAELRARADAEAVMGMNERRRLLAETARSVPKRETATHGERIAALKLDAELAGEYRQEVGINAEVSVAAVLRSLGDSSVVPVGVGGEVVSVSVEPDRLVAPALPIPAPCSAAEESPQGQTPTAGPVGADAILDARSAWEDLE